VDHSSTASDGAEGGAIVAPHCHFADCNLEDLVADSEPTDADATDGSNDKASNAVDPSYSPSDPSLLLQKGGVLILDDCTSPPSSSPSPKTPTRYTQRSPITINESKRCLRAVARLHAAALEDWDVLEVAEKRLCRYGGSYHLENRNPKELRDMEKSWDTFVDAFQSVAPPGFFQQPSVHNLGRRIQKMAPYISSLISPKPTDRYATIVHGDYKAMNVFLPITNDDGDDDSDEEEGQAVMIDFASAGVGFGMLDVAMHVHHAVRPEDLANGGEEQLIDAYLTTMNGVVADKKGQAAPIYPRDVAIRHYRLASIDYTRFVLGRFWRSASVKGFGERRDRENTTLINRDVGAALACVEKVGGWLLEIERELEEKEEKEGSGGVCHEDR